MSSQPEFRTMAQAESEALLSAHNVGRLAFSFRDRVDIQPIHYVFRNGWIFGRTAEGTKLRTLAHHPWVAFEVDEVDALFSWKSVVIHGRIEFPDPTRSPIEHARHATAVEAFRTLVPSAFDEGDPTPDRDIVWALPLHTIEGRAASLPAVL